MNITLNCDASFSKKYRVGSFAYWVTCNMGRLRRSGSLKGGINDPTEAEMKCILNALKFIIVDNRRVFNEVQRFYVNTDSLNAKWMFEGHQNKITKYGRVKPEWKRLNKIYNRKFFSEIRKHKKEIRFYHVKGHSGVQDSRSYVNEWCDKAAKNEISKIINSIENGKLQQNCA